MANEAASGVSGLPDNAGARRHGDRCFPSIHPDIAKRCFGLHRNLAWPKKN
ncbi:hypothetical protein DM47_2963 [Burkholderia mallei]|nr:hypothetical protein DM75_3682 [Burkholderia mallei]KOS74048.1 hypothetical protein DM46_2686 [Burkholderia mallei]KOS95288.1 hypothetical protein DM45_3951 [Burkholderia mallei]KOT03507.1 hypothetical protein DM77_3065 [Burkholderia mallei]KOT16597.1 hypothetical protein DM47_2963 [Burkholderia mallei]